MKIKLGIIGFGGMGKWHAQNVPRAGVEIAAVCDIAKEKQTEAVGMGYRLYRSADELLQDEEVNTVILTVRIIFIKRCVSRRRKPASM